jgi:hypothetical protein
MISRRGIALGGLSTIVLAGCQGGPSGGAGPVASVPSAPVGSDGPSRLVYVAAWNCPVCPGFDARYMTPYERSSEGQRVPLTRVTVPNFRAPFSASGYWPADLQWLRAYLAANRTGGTPYLAVLRGNAVMFAGHGRRWTQDGLPVLQRELDRA